MLTVVFMLMPFQPLIFRVANATTRPMLHRVEYYVDMDKYYFPIFIHGYFTAIICVTSIVANDAIFIIFMQHACGLFIITGWVTASGRKSDWGFSQFPLSQFYVVYPWSSRIKQAIQEAYLIGDANPSITKDMAYQNLVQCVHDHKAAIRFVSFALRSLYPNAEISQHSAYLGIRIISDEHSYASIEFNSSILRCRDVLFIFIEIYLNQGLPSSWKLRTPSTFCSMLGWIW